MMPDKAATAVPDLGKAIQGLEYLRDSLCDWAEVELGAVNDAIALLKTQEQINFKGTFLKREDYVNIGDIMDCLNGLTLHEDAAFHAVGLIEWAMGKRAIPKESLLIAQEPRLVQAADFQSDLAYDGAIPCWKETKSPTRRNGWTAIVYGKWLADNGVARYWTGIPSDEKREATPWLF